ncbi:uncharacterized protein [Elaeis guineensis]|uniref:uncharacterized protein n=1 Tax=Elaeis guineensis var. tenera TaxID=51953 RepID=UPI003C6D23A1
MQEISGRAIEDFMNQDPPHFCKAFINTFSRCDIVDNNLLETFNGYIVQVRHKHIIDMLKDIRVVLMERMFAKKQMMVNSDDNICPRIKKKLEKAKLRSMVCTPRPNRELKFEVRVVDNRYIVDLNKKSCTCRQWDVSGIPCIYAISCINWMKQDIDTYVDDYYKKKTYLMAYQYALQPLNGQQMWPQENIEIILPPTIKKMPGRPKKSKRKDKDEIANSSNKLARIGLKMQYKAYGQYGHNKRTYKHKN